jgi:hypothetical protein
MGDKFSPGRATARRSLHPSWGLMGPLRALATSWQNGGRVSKACHDGGLSTLPSKSTVPVHVSTSSPIHLQMITNTRGVLQRKPWPGAPAWAAIPWTTPQAVAAGEWGEDQGAKLAPPAQDAAPSPGARLVVQRLDGRSGVIFNTGARMV